MKARVTGIQDSELHEYFRSRDILTTDSYKLRKDSMAWMKVGLTLSPANESGGWNTCAFASTGCKALCLKSAGRLQGHLAAEARVRRTRYFYTDRARFMANMAKRLQNAMKRARASGRKLAARFNVLSDLDWATIAPHMFGLVDQVYDYTKDAARYRRFLAGKLPSNYHLTFSRSESNEATCLEFLSLGGTVTVVVRDEATKAGYMATGYRGFPCLDGDVSDNRWMDPAGHVVLLRAKGKARKATSGFVVDSPAAELAKLSPLIGDAAIDAAWEAERERRYSDAGLFEQTPAAWVYRHEGD